MDQYFFVTTFLWWSLSFQFGKVLFLSIGNAHRDKWFHCSFYWLSFRSSILLGTAESFVGFIKSPVYRGLFVNNNWLLDAHCFLLFLFWNSKLYCRTAVRTVLLILADTLILILRFKSIFCKFLFHLNKFLLELGHTVNEF